MDASTLYVAGIYNGPGGALLPSHRAALWNVQGVLVGGKEASAVLDLETASFTRVYAIQPGCTVRQVNYAHRVNRHLLIQTLELKNEEGVKRCLVSLARVAKPTSDFTEIRTTSYGNYSVSLFETLVAEEPNGPKPLVGLATTSVSGELNVPAGGALQVAYITAIYTSLDSKDPSGDAQRAYEAAEGEIEALWESHALAWRNLLSSRIVIEGDTRLAQITNAAIYYLLSSMRDDWPWSNSPGGLASDGYNGHIFWDAETWMYPALLPFWPHIASGSMLQYRFNHMKGASDKARSYKGQNWLGLMFPWESAFSGLEVTPTWAPTGLLEQHITSDIAFATRQYFYATGDIHWLSRFFPMISGMADFWASRVTYDTSALETHYKMKGDMTHDARGQAVQGQILNVIPPDEYAVGVNNSIYTNFAASLACEWALQAAKALGGGGISQQTIQSWTRVSRSLALPFDSNRGIHLEYDGYNGQIIKQADVVLLGYPLEMKMPLQIRRNDLAYYEERTDANGPAMTWAMHSVGWLELGEKARAEAMFVKGYANAQAPYYIWTETPTGGTVNFLTGAGGFLQSIINGYGGLRIRGVQTFFFNPSPPPTTTTSISLLGISLCGSKFDVKWNATVVTVNAREMDGCNLSLSFPSSPNPIPITIGKPIYTNIGNQFTITGSQ